MVAFMPRTRDDCAICKLPNQPVGGGTTNTQYRMDCERCGKYEVEFVDGEGAMRVLADEDRPLFSGWVYKQNHDGIIPVINGAIISEVSTKPKLTFEERVHRFLIFLLENT